MSDSEYVLIESSDGYSFSVPRDIAMASGMLKSMLDEDSAFAEAKAGVVRLDYRGIIILKIIEYLQFKVQYAGWPATDIREDFKTRIDPYIALELLTAADYLEA